MKWANKPNCYIIQLEDVTLMFSKRPQGQQQAIDVLHNLKQGYLAENQREAAQKVGMCIIEIQLERTGIDPTIIH